MKLKILMLSLLVCNIAYSQQFKTLVIEKQQVDENNQIFKTGNAFVYDYEIIDNGEKYKLSVNKGMHAGSGFELIKEGLDTTNLKIQLLVPKVNAKTRTNKNQTEIYYIFEPNYNSFNRTGIVENSNNTWIHPPREGFFRALETCPFPFVKLPLQIGKKWSDKMKISNSWSHEKWGVWNGKLMLNYDYEIAKKLKLKTAMGDLECFVINASANSDIGKSYLKMYYSEMYGFIRLEYTMATGLQVNLNMEKCSSGNDFNDLQAVLSYMMKCKKKNDSNVN
ncbi:hypothetical protein DF185_05825 [Marinifilum breve]|uniref:DUF3108 domain-containing protein n=1 Tax=Marinifilum breve TaxID=2184082 RepID=A0A2V4A097_9BACT|nr:hypothetical protein [Marinifilum breve]PXY02162.1 hypothetical protein DF185_05825 [Marinifilum breve]